MKITLNEPPRKFLVGLSGDICIKDMGDVHLAPNEQVTFVTESGCRHDFARKSWGFYATPSINGRLREEGFSTALVSNRDGSLYIIVVERAQLDGFEAYCREQDQTVIRWLDQPQQ